MRLSQTMRAVLRLRELLLSGEFAPGARMSEIPLVERLGVSRTPLRLALARLEHEGLLDRLAGGGYVVKQFSQSDIDDAIELRGVLEGTAARLAAERGIDPSHLAALRVCCTRMDTVVHESDVAAFVRYMDLNQRFHSLMVEAARSPVIERALEGIVALPFASPNAFVLAQAELPESREVLVVAQSHHRGLVEAMANHEGARAESLAREHARISRHNLEIVLRSRDARERVPGASLIKLTEKMDAEAAGRFHAI